MYIYIYIYILYTYKYIYTYMCLYKYYLEKGEIQVDQLFSCIFCILSFDI